MNIHTSTQQPIAIGSDHAGFEYKQAVKEWLTGKGFAVIDFGAASTSSVDYPEVAHPLATAVEKGEAAFGILFCGSANGVAITANKHQHIRAGLAWNTEVAQLIRQHNNANIICIPARFVTTEAAMEMVQTFMDTAFEGGRHETRVNKIPCC
ncbi:ribose 5-phosphate isomerase B [Deminuibacter soli]|uniref:Ribose 5-phosphate isomerase B n=1 Tax=Deminuibacter soli TaxID=2291815 RepID=A0A3E1NR87_9BACT|nr:ribose 5-phosphate isomerase B [Deminuibacter soli]RFM30451.1 ribose 5-phosphate isomerase B [Deminuibacter soli]